MTTLVDLKNQCDALLKESHKLSLNDISKDLNDAYSRLEIIIQLNNIITEKHNIHDFDGMDTKAQHESRKMNRLRQENILIEGEINLRNKYISDKYIKCCEYFEKEKWKGYENLEDRESIDIAKKAIEHIKENQPNSQIMSDGKFTDEMKAALKEVITRDSSYQFSNKDTKNKSEEIKGIRDLEEEIRTNESTIKELKEQVDDINRLKYQFVYLHKDLMELESKIDEYKVSNKVRVMIKKIVYNVSKVLDKLIYKSSTNKPSNPNSKL